MVTMENASAKMATELESAQHSTVIGPGVITALVAVKSNFDVAAAELKAYKENNKEVDTLNVLKDAKKQVTDSRKQFTILRKIVNLKCPANQAADEAV